MLTPLERGVLRHRMVPQCAILDSHCRKREGGYRGVATRLGAVSLECVVAQRPRLWRDNLITGTPWPHLEPHVQTSQSRRWLPKMFLIKARRLQRLHAADE